jgi:hypothetical protein
MLERRSFMASLAAGLAAPAGGRSRLEAGGTVVFDGRRTFPMALYQVPELGSRAAGLKAAKEAGFDVVSCAAKKEALDEAAAHGLGAWCSVGSVAGAKPEGQRQRITALVGQLKDHAALRYWETEDEPSYQWKKAGPRVKPEAIRETYALLKRLDPSRLVYLNHSPTNLVSTLREYNPGGDLIATDVYPVIPHGIREQYALWPDGRQGDFLNTYVSQVGPYADKMRAVAGPDRAVLMVLQGFAWEMLRDAKERDAKMVVYPTRDELLFMAVQSIVHGVNGLVWWGLSYTPREAGLWTDLAAVTKLLRGLGDALIAKRAVNLQVEYHDTGHSLDKGLEFTTRAAGRETVWLGVNADSNPVEATVRGLPEGLEAVWGGRPERVANGWRTKLAPFGVAIWRTGK